MTIGGKVEETEPSKERKRKAKKERSVGAINRWMLGAPRYDKRGRRCTEIGHGGKGCGRQRRL